MKVFADENLSQEVHQLKRLVGLLEKRIDSLQSDLDYYKRCNNSHLIRVKNDEEFSNDIIWNNYPYRDLSPEKAFELYNDKDKDFILLDVSEKDWEPFIDFPEATKIPLEEIEFRSSHLPGKGTPIFVISEKGTRSILACKKLHKLGFYNINHISGGYKFWPGHKGITHLDLDENQSA